MKSSQLNDIDAALGSEDENERWAAAIAAEEMIPERPWDVWRLIVRHGVSSNSDTRDAVATCMLEHLLEKHFDPFFGLLEDTIRDGAPLLGDTLLRSWKMGQAKDPQNSARWDRLANEVRRA